MMRNGSAVFILAFFFLTGIGYWQPVQAAATTPVAEQRSAVRGSAVEGAQTPVANTNVPAPAVTASSLLQPALRQTQSTLSSLKIDKWKKGSVREEAGENVNALLHDLDTNIPPLMTAADADPAALSRAIPLIKHLDAFYDVLLRVEEASRVSAPSDQISALQQLLLDVNRGRIAYDDALQTQAANQEKQALDLRTELKAEKEAAATREAKASAAAAAPCKPATPVRRRRRTTKKEPSAGTPGAPKTQ